MAARRVWNAGGTEFERVISMRHAERSNAGGRAFIFSHVVTFCAYGTRLCAFGTSRRNHGYSQTLAPSTGDDPVKVDSKHYTVEFENERVRVVRIKYRPGEQSVMHGHPESISVFLTDARAKFTYPTGGRRTSPPRLARCCTWTPLRTCRRARARNHARLSKWN